MKQLIKRHSEDEIKKGVPITGLLDGWFFRQTEVSACVYEVSGTDLWGRGVSETGTDPEAMLASCVESAREIQQHLRERSGE